MSAAAKVSRKEQNSNHEGAEETSGKDANANANKGLRGPHTLRHVGQSQASLFSRVQLFIGVMKC